MELRSRFLTEYDTSENSMLLNLSLYAGGRSILIDTEELWDRKGGPKMFSKTSLIATRWQI